MADFKNRVLEFGNTYKNYIRILVYSILFFSCAIYYADRFGFHASDASIYINNSIFVNPFYPMVIDILGLIVGEENYKWISIIQFTCGFFVLTWACGVISKVMYTIMEIEILFFVILLNFYIGNGGAYGFFIFTEALAYPLYILLFAYLLRLIINRDRTDFVRSIYILMALMFLRAQFITFYPLLVLIILLFSFINRAVWFKAKYFALLLITYFAVQLFPYTYNYFAGKGFIGAKEAGFVLSSHALYFARAEDEKLFADDNTRRTFRMLYREGIRANALKYCNSTQWRRPTVEENSLNSSFFNWRNQQVDQRYIKALVSMPVKTECDTGFSHYIESLDDREFMILNTFRNLDTNDWKEIDPILIDISKTLFRAHFAEWMENSFNVFLYYCGFGIPELGLIIFIAVVILTLFRLKAMVQGRAGVYTYFFLLLVITSFANYAFLGMFAPISGKRYVIYNYALISGFILLLMQKLNNSLILKKKD